MNQGPGSDGTLVGDPTKVTNQSVATFPDLRVTRTGTGYTLTASAGGFASVTSNPFSILEPTDIIGLAFRIQPGATAAGRAIAPALKVATVNSLGNTVGTGTSPITLSLVVGTGTPGASLGGTLTVSAVGGEATFSDITVDSAGANYRLLATSPGLTEDTSIAFSVTAGTAVRLAFTGQPATEPARSAFTPPPRVSILDAAGNLVTGATNTVALYITNSNRHVRRDAVGSDDRRGGGRRRQLPGREHRDHRHGIHPDGRSHRPRLRRIHGVRHTTTATTAAVVVARRPAAPSRH